MILKVKCPNPGCPHHDKPFDHLCENPNAKAGGNARWKKMTKKQRAEHIARMTAARLKKRNS